MPASPSPPAIPIGVSVARITASKVRLGSSNLLPLSPIRLSVSMPYFSRCLSEPWSVLVICILRLQSRYVLLLMFQSVHLNCLRVASQRMSSTIKQ